MLNKSGPIHNLTLLLRRHLVNHSKACSGRSLSIDRAGVQWLKSCLLGKSEIAGSNPALAFKFRRNKNVSSLLIRKDSILWGASASSSSFIKYMLKKSFISLNKYIHFFHNNANMTYLFQNMPTD